VRSHDAEKFVGVVRRYGMTEDVRRLVEAANSQPEIGNYNIARACGTCMPKSA
jgi:hypothetical protein